MDVKQDVRIVVTLRTTGNVDVSGPLGNALQCYGMLECAKDAVRRFNAESEAKETLAKLNALPPAGDR